VAESGPEAVPPQEALSYEQARDKLAAVVKRLEAGGLTLEQSLELWERGERLAAVCEEWLDGARARLAAAMAKRDDQDQAAAQDDAPFLSARLVAPRVCPPCRWECAVKAAARWAR
jgi:exodeoxyribonuclease VII small subunit